MFLSVKKFSGTVRRKAAALSAVALALAFSPAFGEPDQPFATSLTAARQMGGTVQYQELTTSSSSIQTFAVPLTLPLEATIGRLFLGSSFEYIYREIRTETRAPRDDSQGYASLDGRFRAYQTDRVRMDITESVGLPLRRKDLAASTTGYDDVTRVDTGIQFHYMMDRTTFRLGLGHRWNLAKNDFDPGDIVNADLSLGYGIGQSPLEAKRYPVNLYVGITSRYNYGDRYRKDQMMGTEYGTVFFAPGLSLSGRSVDFQATVELPIHHMQPEKDAPRERVRGTIGMRYLFD